MSGEFLIPLEFRGLRCVSAKRECDDPYVNFIKIRNHRLWLKHEIDQQAKELKQAGVASKPGKR